MCICSQDNFNCFYCTVLYAQILLAGNGRDMHLLVTMTYDLSDVYASDWSARRYDLTGDCDSPDTFSPTVTDCTGLTTHWTKSIPTSDGFLFNISALTPTATGFVTNQVFPTPGIKDPVLPTCVVFYVTPHVTMEPT